MVLGVLSVKKLKAATNCGYKSAFLSMKPIFNELAFRCFYVALLIGTTNFWLYVNFGIMLEYGLSCFVYHQYGFFCFEALSWQWLTCAQNGVLSTDLHLHFGAKQPPQISPFGGQDGLFAPVMQNGASNTMQGLSTSSKSWHHLNLACALISHGVDPKTYNVGLALQITQHVPWLGLTVLATTSFLAPAVFRQFLQKGLWVKHALLALSFLAWFIFLAALNLFYEFTLEPLDSELFTM